MKPLLAIAISGMLLTGCSKSVDSKSKTFTYPLALGNQWTYTCVGTHEYGNPLKVDTTGIFTLSATVEQVDTIRPGVLSYTMRSIEVGSEMPYGIPECTYLNLSEGMYLLSWKLTVYGGSPVLPRSVPFVPGIGSTGPPLTGFPNAIGSVAALPDPEGLTAAQVANPADTLPLILAYPQHSGLLWTCHDSGGAWSFRSERVIEGRETITTPAGSFDCWRIRHIRGAPEADWHIVDWMSAQGLIRRRVSVYFSSTGDWVGAYELASHKLH
jgi:hypothetical protein